MSPAAGREARWRRLQAFCRFDLGVSESEFHHLAIPDFNALLERWEISQEREDLRMAILASLLANIFSSGRRRFSPIDFMISKKHLASTEMTADEILATIEQWQKFFSLKTRPEESN